MRSMNMEHWLDNWYLHFAPSVRGEIADLMIQ